MNKAQRDSILNQLSSSERQEFRRLMQELRSARKTSPAHRVMAREMVESEGSEWSPPLRNAVEAVIQREEKGPKVGEQPPDFFLKKLGTEDRVRLSSFRGESPVALVFGSYT